MWQRRLTGNIYQWGLVAGRTQTYLHWYTRYSREPEPRLWLHDVMRPDGSLFDPAGPPCCALTSARSWRWSRCR